MILVYVRSVGFFDYRSEYKRSGPAGLRATNNEGTSLPYEAQEWRKSHIKKRVFSPNGNRTAACLLLDA